MNKVKMVRMGDESGYWYKAVADNTQPVAAVTPVKPFKPVTPQIPKPQPQKPVQTKATKRHNALMAELKNLYPDDF